MSNLIRTQFAAAKVRAGRSRARVHVRGRDRRWVSSAHPPLGVCRSFVFPLVARCLGFWALSFAPFASQAPATLVQVQCSATASAPPTDVPSALDTSDHPKQLARPLPSSRHQKPASHGDLRSLRQSTRKHARVEDSCTSEGEQPPRDACACPLMPCCSVVAVVCLFDFRFVCTTAPCAPSSTARRTWPSST